jgi:hypothetical protein
MSVANADAYRASKGVAQYAAEEVARLVYLDVPEATGYGRGNCMRTSSQRVWCWSYNELSFEDLSQGECWWRTVTYRNKRSGQYRVTALADTVDCFETVPAPAPDPVLTGDDCIDYGICKRSTPVRPLAPGRARPKSQGRRLPAFERRLNLGRAAKKVRTAP